MIFESHGFPLGSPGPFASETLTDVEKGILKLVVDGFERWATCGFNRNSDREDDYTIRLVDCMNEIRRERGIMFYPVFQHTVPSDAMWKGIENPSRAGRIDIGVLSWKKLAGEDLYSIECKHLAPKRLPRLYVTEGIDRFVQGKYGAKARVGAMIGYVAKGAIGDLVRCVNSQVEGVPSMGSDHVLVSANSIEWLSTVFTSKHRRSSSFPTIRLTHLFFDMSEVEPLV